MVNVIFCVGLVGRVHILLDIAVVLIIPAKGPIGCNAASDRPSGINLFHHSLLSCEIPMLTNPVSSPVVHRKAIPWHKECATVRPFHRLGRTITAGVDVGALHVLCSVGHTSVIRNLVVKKILKDHPSIASIAAWWFSSFLARHAVEQHLSGKLHIRETTFSVNSYAIIQAQDGSMDPTAPAINGDVLVHFAGHPIPSCMIAPVEVLRQL
mmetsp:Transcript_13120/g.29859  ORF Transcript_13120/g.29859 Transcript_13120/m.29859 type:complete len:210 (-) Transcript_13120:198-827(-)